MKRIIRDIPEAFAYVPNSKNHFEKLEKVWLMDLLSTLCVKGWEE
jgi:hypothetical protein